LEDIEGCLGSTTTILRLRQDIDDPVQCGNLVDRTIYYCGMDSHVSIHNGRRVYLQEMTASNCRRIHETGTIDLGDRESYITGLKSNNTTIRSIIVAASLWTDGAPTSNDPYRTRDNMVVQASIRITSRNFEAPIRRSSDEIILRTTLQNRIRTVFKH